MHRCKGHPLSTCFKKNCSDHCSCWSPLGVPKARYGRPFLKDREGVSVVRGRFFGASELGQPGSSQNICNRVPSANPSSGITGLDCSQPPEGVAETKLPQRSTMSRWQVSPRAECAALVSAAVPDADPGAAGSAAGSAPKVGSPPPAKPA